MHGLSIFSARFTQRAAVTDKIVSATGLALVTDADILNRAAAISKLAPEKIQRFFIDGPPVFNPFTLESESALAAVKLALAQTLQARPLIVSGYCTVLIPRPMEGLLHTCLTAGSSFRRTLAMSRDATTRQAAARIIGQDDQHRSAWVSRFHPGRDPEDPDLFDLIIPMDETTPARAARKIADRLAGLPRPGKNGAKDFLLASTLEAAFVRKGHHVKVKAKDGAVDLIIDKNVLMIARLEKELRALAQKIPGISSITVRADKGSEEPGPRPHMPASVLLVDDEKEFVQTLSERLRMRDIPSEVAYDGASALDRLETHAPGVMVVDLKMPGMDGMELIRQVREKRPGIQIIVLTGHGSEQDRKKCMETGAFAYFQKPMDINMLSRTLKKAFEKTKETMEP